MFKELIIIMEMYVLENCNYWKWQLSIPSN